MSCYVVEYCAGIYVGLSTAWPSSWWCLLVCLPGVLLGGGILVVLAWAYEVFGKQEYALVVYQGHDDATGRLKTDAEGRSSYQEIREGTEGQGLVFFRDQTSSKQTYGGGRCLVLDVSEPDVLDHVDFNRAMNPTCAYNSYCTCPFAPLENTLPIAITAGELTPAVH